MPTECRSIRTEDSCRSSQSFHICRRCRETERSSLTRGCTRLELRHYCWWRRMSWSHLRSYIVHESTQQINGMVINSEIKRVPHVRAHLNPRKTISRIVKEEIQELCNLPSNEQQGSSSTLQNEHVQSIHIRGRFIIFFWHLVPWGQAPQGSSSGVVQEQSFLTKEPSGHGESWRSGQTTCR